MFSNEEVLVQEWELHDDIVICVSSRFMGHSASCSSMVCSRAHHPQLIYCPVCHGSFKVRMCCSHSVLPLCLTTI